MRDFPNDPDPERYEAKKKLFEARKGEIRVKKEHGQLLRELLTIPAPIRSGTLQITDAQRIAYSMDARVAMAFAADLLGHIGADRRNSAEDTAMDAWGWLQQRRDTRWDFKKAGEPERCPACRLVNRHRAGCPKQNEP